MFAGAPRPLLVPHPRHLHALPPGYDAAYEGSVMFTPPAASGDLGTYGQSSELLAVRDGAWGSEFSGGWHSRPGG